MVCFAVSSVAVVVLHLNVETILYLHRAPLYVWLILRVVVHTISRCELFEYGSATYLTWLPPIILAFRESCRYLEDSTFASLGVETNFVL